MKECSIIDLEAGNKVFYVVRNSRMIEIYTNAINIEEQLINDKIESITIGKTVFKIGDNFKHDLGSIPSDYVISRIEKGASPSEKYSKGFTLFTHDRNKTTTYILPCLGENDNFFYTDSYLINAYLNNERDQLHLLYRFSTSEDYAVVENKLIKHPLFRKMDNSIKGFDVFIFDIEEIHLKDVEYFVLGKYSKFSEILKLKIKKFYKLSAKSRLWQIITRDKELVAKMERDFFCSFSGVDLDEKPKLKNEIWQH